jgi:hypothetical protein
LRCVALRCVALRCVALRCVALRCVALRCVALRGGCASLHPCSPSPRRCFAACGRSAGRSSGMSVDERPKTALAPRRPSLESQWQWFCEDSGLVPSVRGAASAAGVTEASSSSSLTHGSSVVFAGNLVSSMRRRSRVQVRGPASLLRCNSPVSHVPGTSVVVRTLLKR